MLTLGYAITIVAFIRVGEKLLQKFGARRPMIWGSADRRLLGPVAHADEPAPRAVQGPRDRLLHAVRSGAGLLRDALHRCRTVEPARRPGWIGRRHLQDGVVSRGLLRSGDFGGDLHGAERNDDSRQWLSGVITFTGRQDNVQVRQAALIALGFNLMMVVAAIVSIMLTVPKVRRSLTCSDVEESQ